jgi:putative ABC transport system permease protein
VRALDKLRLRLRTLLRRDQVERELAEELRFHVDQLIAENIAAGMTPDGARAAALRTVGGVAQYEEECRDMRRLSLLEDLWKDVRYAARVLRRAPAFTVVAVLTLALGIGATTAIFSVVNGVLLKPLPFAEPERLVGVWHQRANHGRATYFTYRDNQQVFQDIGAWDGTKLTITGRGEPERVEALAVSQATLPLLGVRPARGRLFSQEDDRPGAPMRVLLTHGYWQRRFGAAGDVVGRSLEVDGKPAEIIGVLPSTFRFLHTAPALLRPMQLARPPANSVNFGFQALARLRPGVTLAQANADLARMIALLPPGFAGYRLQPNVRPLIEDVSRGVEDVLWMLLGTVGIVLLIACANVANLFLVRADTRRQELAVRTALGAGRGRIARQLLAESLVLGLAGGAVGLLFARAGVALLQRMAPAALPRLEDIGIDPAVLLFALGTSLVTGVLFGLIPVLRLRSPGAAALREGVRTASDGRARQRTRSTLVVAEVALALVLLIVSGLMIRTVVAMRQVHPGFVRPAEVQTFRVDMPAGLVQTPPQMAVAHQQIAQRLRQVSGVVSVGLSSSITMDGEDNTNPALVEHLHAPYDQPPPFRRFKAVGPGYFESMGNPIVAGRAISWADIHATNPVVVVSAALAREHWQQPSRALGKRIGRPGSWHEIVGVVGDERDDGLDRPPTAIVYWPLVNDTYVKRSIAYAVRSPRVGSPGFLSELQQAVWSTNPKLPLAEVQTLAEIHARSMAQTSFVMVTLAIAAAVALLLGLVGLYGVISYIAAQRTREIGIRMALGALTGDVRRLFLRHGLVLTATGIALGLAASLALTRIMSALLFGVGPMDPATYATVSAGLAAVALLATWLPARRASRVDPITALRG